jgi:hypothetical protein
MEKWQMALTPWHKSATPREDLRKSKPMDAAEFAVNLDRVRDGKAPDEVRGFKSLMGCQGGLQRKKI